MNTKYSNIRVLVARTLQAIEDGQCDDVRECDTIKEAKAFAKYALTEAYMHSGEFSEPMNAACIKADEAGWMDDCLLHTFFRKGYVENAQEVEPCEHLSAMNAHEA